MYVCKYFAIHELVPQQVFEEKNELAWELLDERLLITLDALRERFGPITVNNYFWGGDREWSGLRTPESPYYNPYSQHTFGRAADCLFKDIEPEKVRQFILARPFDPNYQFVNGVELNVSWLHFDVRNCERIKTYQQP